MLKKIRIPATVTEIQSGTFAECSGLEELTYLGDSEISNDIGLREWVTVHVSESYPFKQIGGRTVTPMTKGSPSSGKELSGGAIAGIVIGAVALVVIIAGCVYYFTCRTRNTPKDEEGNEEV